MGSPVADPRLRGLQEGEHATRPMLDRVCSMRLPWRGRASSDEVFHDARKLTTWHYRWMILHEFLPLFIGQALVNDILEGGRRFYRPGEAYIPVEFQGAAYRFGHSMVAPLVPSESDR